jgi:hypothetical protein
MILITSAVEESASAMETASAAGGANLHEARPSADDSGSCHDENSRCSPLCRRASDDNRKQAGSEADRDHAGQPVLEYGEVKLKSDPEQEKDDRKMRDSAQAFR